MEIKTYQLKAILIIIIAVTCGAAAYFSTVVNNPYRKLPKIYPEKQYLVTNVLDGDTFEIKVGWRKIKVRMIGVDTPETLDPRKPVQCYGKEASEETKRILVGKLVTVEKDSTQDDVDRYNRLLAYVYTESGLFVNKYLIEGGYGREYTYSKSYKHQSEFKEAEMNARNMKLGQWSGVC